MSAPLTPATLAAWREAWTAAASHHAGQTHYEGCGYHHARCAVLGLLDEVERLQQELAQERVRLAGVLTQADGYDDPEVVPGVYGWSLPYEKVRSLRQEQTRLREALENYGAHDKDCILGQCSAGRPTSDGGYEHLYGYGDEQRWYRSRPVNELPPCTCGFDAALTTPPTEPSHAAA